LKASEAISQPRYLYVKLTQDDLQIEMLEEYLPDGWITACPSVEPLTKYLLEE
jgi:hypothetical protein